jgi:hypothetical protein
MPDDATVARLHANSVPRPARVDESLLPHDELQFRRVLTTEVVELISDHALRLRQVGGEQLSVVMQPDPRTRLRLELTFDGSVVEARAAMEQGDFGLLCACWPELQSRLLEQGVRIAPLTAAPVSVPAWTGGEQPSRRDPAFTKAETRDDPSRPVANNATIRKGQAARVSRGANHFDLWA